MVINDIPPFIFFHIPKTAGTSITSILQTKQTSSHPLCLENTKHETAQAFVDRVGEEVFKRYYSFSVVRHPLDRIISHFSYLKSNPDQFQKMCEINTLEQYVDAIKSQSEVVIQMKGILPQYKFLSVNEKNMAINEVIRYENLDFDIRKLFKHLGLDIGSLPKLNVTTWKKPQPSLYVQHFVESYYAKDFELFNY
jgi:hypothetical protein